MDKERWEVFPCLGLGPLRFGMTREECRAILGPRFQPEPEARRDRYDGGEFELEYDESWRLEYLSISSECNRDPWLQGTQLLGRPQNEVLRDLQHQTQLEGSYHDELSVLYRSLQMELYQCFGGGNDFQAVNLGADGYFK